ncbi:nuclear transcription factor Y subunit C-2-like [Daucus carota subsp. sativus]|uniref:nuclear transcription factor Y subunit C-2-like n=1 Tax=Daucus carota subsp. sativus TaxID=79200 RepID=UPI00308273BB
MYLNKHSLPLAPIKRIMKADNDIRMIAQEANLPLFAKTCEMFIGDMTSQAWIVTEEDKRRTVQKNDIVEAVLKRNMFDFLDNIIPRDELKERILKAKNARQLASSSTDSGTHGNNASNVTGAVVQETPTHHLDQQPSLFPSPQTQQIPEQHMSFNFWPQAQQLLDQQTPEQTLISCTQAENTTDQHTSQHYPVSCILPEQSPGQQNLEQSSLQPELQQDQQN